MKPFFDTNVLVYAFSHDRRAERARELLQLGGTAGVQCLNEFANVARRKLGMDWPELEASLEEIRRLCRIAVLPALGLHDHGLRLARRYGLSIFDGGMLAAALAADCSLLWSEDLHDGLVVEDRLLVRNPFASGVS